jgi:hypothetical protein
MSFLWFALSISLKRLAHFTLGLLAKLRSFFLKTPGKIHELLNSQQAGAALDEPIKSLLKFILLLRRHPRQSFTPFTQEMANRIAYARQQEVAQ